MHLLCGAVFGSTADPVQEARASIRWAYEKAAQDAEPNEQGTYDYWCGRAWCEHSTTLPEAPSLFSYLTCST